MKMKFQPQRDLDKDKADEDNQGAASIPNSRCP